MTDLDLFWKNFKKYVEANPCAVTLGAPCKYHLKAKLTGYDNLQIDFCISYKSGGVNKWKTRVELYGLKGVKQVERCIYFESQLENMRKALSDYEVDFRIISEDKQSWKLYAGTNDLVHRNCDDVEIYKYFVKAINRMAEAWKSFFEPYKK